MSLLGVVMVPLCMRMIMACICKVSCAGLWEKAYLVPAHLRCCKVVVITRPCPLIINYAYCTVSSRACRSSFVINMEESVTPVSDGATPVSSPAAGLGGKDEGMARRLRPSRVIATRTRSRITGTTSAMDGE
jgi:hypothetical protein